MSEQRRRSTCSMQDLQDAGLNPFAVQLLAESINGLKGRLVEPITFVYNDAVFTLSELPAQEWTHDTLRDIFKPFADPQKPDSFLTLFARTFLAADERDGPFLAHVAIMLIERYKMWSASVAADESQSVEQP